MKILRLLWPVLLIFALVGPALAQVTPTVARNHTYGATTNSLCWDLGDTGVFYHVLTYRVTGGVSGGTLKLRGYDNAACNSGGVDIIAAFTLTAGGRSSTFESAKRYVRLEPASFTGTGGTISVQYTGWMWDPSPLITYNSTQPTLTDGQKADLQISTRGELKNVICDAAANARCANVDSSNKLLTLDDTELPAAAALADATSNPTVPGTGSFNLCWNGTTWDRCKSATAGAGSTDSSTLRTTSNQGVAAAGSGAWPMAITNTSDTVVKPGDSTNNAIRTNCVTGCSGGTTDTDDGTVAGAQSTGLSIGLQYVWNGSAWIRAVGTTGGYTKTMLGLGESFTDTMQNAATANGNGTSLSVDGFSSSVITVICSVSCSGGTQIIFEAQNDGTNYVAVNASQAGTGSIGTTFTLSGTAATAFQVPVAGYKLLRARILNYSAGTITAIGTAVPVEFNSRTIGLSSSMNTVDTELSATAALADSTSNPTVTSVGAFNQCWNGTTWDRCKTANTATNSLNSTGGGIQATQVVAQCDDTTPTALTENQFGNLRMNCTTHNLPVEVVGSVTVAATVGSPAFVTQTPSATGGWTTFNATSGDGSTACTNSAQSVKSSQGTFGGYEVFNPNTSTAYLVVYNTASGSVTVGTTTPAKVIPVPAGALANYEMANGAQFGTAISIACTTTAAGNGAPSTALDVNINYK